MRLYILAQNNASLTQPIMYKKSHIFAIFVLVLRTLCMLDLSVLELFCIPFKSALMKFTEDASIDLLPLVHFMVFLQYLEKCNSIIKMLFCYLLSLQFGCFFKQCRLTKINQN